MRGELKRLRGEAKQKMRKVFNTIFLLLLSRWPVYFSPFSLAFVLVLCLPQRRRATRNIAGMVYGFAPTETNFDFNTRSEPVSAPERGDVCACVQQNEKKNGENMFDSLKQKDINTPTIKANKENYAQSLLGDEEKFQFAE